MTISEILRKSRFRIMMICQLFGIDEDEVNRATEQGELVMKRGGWYPRTEVFEWAKKKGYKLVGEKDKPATAESPKPETSSGDVAPIIDPAFMQSIMATDLPDELDLKSSRLKDVADAMSKIATATAKHKQTLKDLGQLCDMGEQKNVCDAVFSAMVGDIKSLPTQIGHKAAKAGGVKIQQATQVIEVVSAYMLEQIKGYAAELESRADDFMTAKVSETEKKKKA